MASVDIAINGRPYSLACDDGQEQRILGLARLVDERARRVVSQVGPVSDTLLLLMVSLLMADEVGEAKGIAERAVAEQDGFDAALSRGIDVLSGRLAAIAERLEKA